MSGTQQRSSSQISNEYMARAMDRCGAAVVITDLKGVIQYVNDTFTRLSGYTREEALGNTPSVLKSNRTPGEVYRDMWATIEQGREWDGRVLNRRKPRDGSASVRIHGPERQSDPDEYWSHLTISPVRDAQGKMIAYVAIHRDVTDQVRHEQRQDYERREAQVRADIYAILQTKQSLRRRLGRALAKLLTLNEIEVQNKAGIFLRAEATDRLEMFVTHGEFSCKFMTREQCIPMGACLCGRAAVSGELLISDDCFCDPRHEHVFADMTPHGHYIVPLRASGETLGVMSLFTNPYPSKAGHRLLTLQSIGDTLALTIANDRAQERMMRATVSARKANEAKSRFLANMSHEIRTPLNGIIGFTDLLRTGDNDISRAEQREWLHTIHRSGKHLLHLINDILDLSKVESGELEVALEPCKPMRILAELSSEFRLRAEDKGLPLEIQCATPVPTTITSDPVRLRQILTNLLGNAIKFTTNGHVRVDIRFEECATLTHDEAKTLEPGDPRGPMIEFAIKDTGPGIPPDKCAAIFDPFVQADNSVTRKYGGTGLGLTISRRLAQAMGGSLSVESKVGEGSTFTLRVATGSLDGVPITSEFSAEALHIQSSDAPTDSAVSNLHGKVLLVDDGATNRKLISLILRRAGLAVVTAENGRDAVDQMKHRLFDLILMDIQMPIMDGHTATRALRSAGVDIPIIALTANAMIGDQNECMTSGCNDYLTKPVDAKVLLQVVGRWLAREPGHCPPMDLESATGSVPSSAEPPAVAAIRSTLPTDDPEFHEIVVDFVRQLHDQLEEMQAALRNQDWESLTALAHRLRGSGGTAGFDALTGPSDRVELLVRDNQFDQVAAAIEELVQLAGQIVTDPMDSNRADSPRG